MLNRHSYFFTYIKKVIHFITVIAYIKKGETVFLASQVINVLFSILFFFNIKKKVY